MTSVYQDVYDWLQTLPTVVATFNTGIHPDNLKVDAELPALVYRKLNNPKAYTQDGASNAETVIFQLLCWDNSVLGCSEAADVLEQAISGYRGQVGNRVAGHVMILNRVDLADRETNMQAQVFNVRFAFQ